MSYRARIVVPCYNEAQRLDLGALQQFMAETPDIAFTFVDDGSTDATWDVLHRLAEREPRVDVLQLDRNRGKAEAVRLGMLNALAARDAPILGYWDADLSTPLATILQLAAELDAHPELTMLMASRVQLLGRAIERKPFRHYAGRVIATLAAGTLGLRVYDTQCGAKLVRVSDALAACFADPFITRWMFDVELIARIVASRDQRHAASRVREYPIPVWHDVAGSKISTRAGLRALYDLLRIRFHYYGAGGFR